MTGRKTLGEVRAELEAALGGGPSGDDPVAESLRRFLAAKPVRPLVTAPSPECTVTPRTDTANAGESAH